MGERTIGVVIEGATGRLGATQHLRSLMAIRSKRGLPLANGDRLMPAPVLLGRNAAKLAALAEANAGLKWSTDRDACLADPDIAIYFDATATGGRSARVAAALDAGKHVYVEKAARRNTGGHPGSVAPRRARRPQKRCRTGQIVPARSHQIAQAM
jgi:predicted dehydrogenase